MPTGILIEITLNMGKNCHVMILNLPIHRIKQYTFPFIYVSIAISNFLGSVSRFWTSLLYVLTYSIFWG